MVLNMVDRVLPKKGKYFGVAVPRYGTGAYPFVVLPPRDNMGRQLAALLPWSACRSAFGKRRVLRF